MLPSVGHCRPAVVQHPDIRLACIHHGLDGDHHAGPQLHAPARLAKVRHLRILVHVGRRCRAPQNPVPPRTLRPRPPLAPRRRHRPESLPASPPQSPHCSDASVTLSSRTVSAVNLLAHRHRDGRIAVVAVDHRAAIHRNNVPFLQDPLRRRNAMHHLAVDRGAQHAGKPVIPLECGLRAQLRRCAPRRPSQDREWWRPASRWLAHQLQHLADHLARAAHLLDLLGRLQTTANRSPQVVNDQLSVFSCPLQRPTAEHQIRRLFVRTNQSGIALSRNRSTAATIPAAIAAIGRSPSTSAKRPNVR